mmetsp:Transcript_12516/g.30213  ORF Transcript_12516/g.30213 Transcript_12516/m.30213 type:complete len:363 (-) Transcript_12516:677-1765(-)
MVIILLVSSVGNDEGGVASTASIPADKSVFFGLGAAAHTASANPKQPRHLVSNLSRRRPLLRPLCDHSLHEFQDISHRLRCTIAALHRAQLRLYTLAIEQASQHHGKVAVEDEGIQERDAQRVHVRRSRRLRIRRHVKQCAAHLRRSRRQSARHGRGEVKVTQRGHSVLPFGVKHDVFRLEVPVEKAVVVKRCHSLRHALRRLEHLDARTQRSDVGVVAPGPRAQVTTRVIRHLYHHGGAVLLEKRALHLDETRVVHAAGERDGALNSLELVHVELLQHLQSELGILDAPQPRTIDVGLAAGGVSQLLRHRRLAHVVAVVAALASQQPSAGQQGVHVSSRLLLGSHHLVRLMGMRQLVRSHG